MALIPLDYRIPADNIPFEQWLRLKRFASTLIVASEEWAHFFESGIREGSEGLLCWRDNEIHLVIDWSMKKQTSPSLCVCTNGSDLEFDFHRAAVPFLLTDLARDAGIQFRGRVMDLVDVLRSDAWRSVCRDLNLLHYTSLVAELCNQIDNSQKEAA